MPEGADPFQFQLVRLKLYDMNAKGIEVSFQFQLVRLKYID